MVVCSMPTCERPVQRAVEYALSVLLGEDSSELRGLVSYGEPAASEDSGARITIVPSGFFGPQFGRPESLPMLPLSDIDGVPLLYGRPRVRQEGCGLVVEADLVASTFFLVTRYEEHVRRTVRDEYGRFPGRQSLPCRAGFLHRPIVEEYSRLLRKWLRGMGVRMSDAQKGLSVYLTHDVDCPWLPWNPRYLIRSMIGNLPQRPDRALHPLLGYLGIGRFDPYDTFDDLIRLDRTLIEALGRKRVKVMYFLLTADSLMVRDYMKWAPRRTKRLIERLVASGAQIGLHATCEASQAPELARAEADRLRRFCNQAVTANRFHFLTWREPHDVKNLEDAGLLDDFTMGYADRTGFRLGLCHPVPFFDLVDMRETKVMVHPLSIMECTLDRYMGLDFDEAWSVCQTLIDTVAQFSGEIVLLWHNSTLAEVICPYQRKLYRKLLSHISTAYA